MGALSIPCRHVSEALTVGGVSRENPLMRIGERLRYGRIDTFPATLPEVDGITNWWYATRAPDGSLKALKLDAGINAPAPLSGPQARVPCICLRSSTHKSGSDVTPWEDIHRPDLGYSRYFGDNKVDSGKAAHETLGNARLLEAGALAGVHSLLSVEGEVMAISFLAMDVSFISATLVLPAVLRALVGEGEVWRGEAVVLIKPQFEAGREHVGKGGIVREQAARDIAIERVKSCVVELGGTAVEVIDSPIHGMEGNWEYLLHAWFGREA